MVVSKNYDFSKRSVQVREIDHFRAELIWSVKPNTPVISMKFQSLETDVASIDSKKIEPFVVAFQNYDFLRLIFKCKGIKLAT